MDGLFGAISGALATTGIGAVASMFIDAGLNALNGIITTGMSNNWVFEASDWIGIAYSVGLSFLISNVSKPINGTKQFKKAATMTNNVGKKLLNGSYTKSTTRATMNSIKAALKESGKAIYNAFTTEIALRNYLSVYCSSISTASFSVALSRIME